MSKAEDRAFEKYPDYRGMDGGYITQRNKRMVYVEGYHQAEKDMELGWEDIETIQEMANKYCKYHSCEPRFFVYKEVLKQFKDYKERKEK